jgi:hypothetical protein
MSILNTALAHVPYAAILPKDGGAVTHALVVNGGIGTTIDSMRPLAKRIAAHDDTAVYLMETPLAAADANEGVRNIEAMHQFVAAQHPGAKLAYVGESAGGNAMLAWDAQHNVGADRAPVLVTPVSALTTTQAFTPSELFTGMRSIVDRTHAGAKQIVSPNGKGVPLTNNRASQYFDNAPDASKTINASVVGDSIVNLVKGVRLRDRGNITFLEPGDDQLAYRGAGNAYSHLFRGADYVRIPGAAHAMTQEWQPGVAMDTVVRDWLATGHAKPAGT